MILTLVLFAIAVGTIWIKDIKISTWSSPLWMYFLTAALVSAFIHHYVEIIGILEIILFALLAYLSRYTRTRLIYIVCLFTIGFIAVAITMGKLPGFHNPNIVTDMQFSNDSKPFTHRLKIGSISIGIILLAVLCNPARTWNTWSTIFRQSAAIIFIAPAVIMSCALLLNYVEIDVKFITYTLVFLICNLLFTCVVEESFFRGLIQNNIAKSLARWKYGGFIAIGIASLLFGLMHFQGGLIYIALATLAGIFYGYAKYRVKHIEAAILTHFSVNAVHFIAFTYPNF